MKQKTKLLDNVENFLLSKKGYKKSWMRSFLVIIFCSICFGVVLGISYQLGPMSNKIPSNNPHSYVYILNQHIELMQTATYMSIAGIVVMIFPFICGIATWMIGINQVTKSKFFHLFIWFMVSVAVILAIIVIIFLIRSSIFEINDFPTPPPPPSEDAPTT